MMRDYVTKASRKKHTKKEKKIEKVKCSRFSQEIYNKQKSRMLKHDAMQVKMNRRLQELVLKLEKEKILEEKKALKEFTANMARDKRILIESFQQYWNDQIRMTKDSIEHEKYKRKLIESAENHAMSDWKKEINKQQKAKLEKLLNILDQQDTKYEVENFDLERMEAELIKMYKRN